MEIYTHDELVESVRKRPGMYIGTINSKGLIECLKMCISNTIFRTASDNILINLISDQKGELVFSNLKTPVEGNFTSLRNDHNKYHYLDLPILNALSSNLNFTLTDNQDKVVLSQKYEQGTLVEGVISKKKFSGSTLAISFHLDPSIWQSSLEWNQDHIINEIREFAYLFSSIIFEVNYIINDIECKAIHAYKNGLYDRLQLEKLKSYASSCFDTHIVANLQDAEMEIAFLFNANNMDQYYLKSFVNDFHTPENGSHVDAVFLGMKKALLEFVNKRKTEHSYLITKENIIQNIQLLINIKLEKPTFRGATKNLLANEEIIEPISNYVYKILIEKLEKDERMTLKFMRIFISH